MDIKLEGIIIQHEVLVCDDLAHDMLIGTDILKPNKFVINFAKGTLEVNGKTDHLIFRSSKEVCRVTVSETITIPPCSMINVVGKVDRGSVMSEMTGVLEPEKCFEERYSTGVLKVVATIKNGTIPVRIFNPQEKPRRIYRGSTVGELCPLLGDGEEDTPSSYREVYDNISANTSGTSPCMTAQPKDREKIEEEMAQLFEIENSAIPENEKKRVYEILARHNKVVSRGTSDLGFLTTVEHSINTGDQHPIRLPSRRIPFQKREEVQREVEAMLSSDIIEPSTSPWNSPVVLVAKKDGTRRFCIDYRKLNEVTKKDVYPLPRCEDILHALSGSAYFTHLDLVRGYWQIGVKEEDREKTAFSTADGHYQFRRMPFGLTNAPATFQRAMNTILYGLNWKDCLVYLDDIVIFARTLGEHHQKLDSVLQRLEDSGLKLNAKKCHFLKEKILLLGHVVSRDGVSTDPEKIQVLKDWSVPHDLTSLRSFLGCAGYYRQFIPNYANIAAPLYKLEQKNVVFNWTLECDDAFKTLK